MNIFFLNAHILFVICRPWGWEEEAATCAPMAVLLPLRDRTQEFTQGPLIGLPDKILGCLFESELEINNA